MIVDDLVPRKKLLFLELLSASLCLSLSLQTVSGDQMSFSKSSNRLWELRPLEDILLPGLSLFWIFLVDRTRASVYVGSFWTSLLLIMFLVILAKPAIGLNVLLYCFYLAYWCVFWCLCCSLISSQSLRCTQYRSWIGWLWIPLCAQHETSCISSVNWATNYNSMQPISNLRSGLAVILQTAVFWHVSCLQSWCICLYFSWIFACVVAISDFSTLYFSHIILDLFWIVLHSEIFSLGRN